MDALMHEVRRIVKKLVPGGKLFLIILFIPSFVFSQEFGFKIHSSMRSPGTIYLRDVNKIFRISSSIDAVYVFRTSDEAKMYLNTLHDDKIPRISYQIGSIRIYVHELKSVNYYMNNSPLGSIGDIKSINNLVFTYANNSSWNSRSGVVGKLTKIGDTKITYWTASGYTEKGQYRGKIKSVGNKLFMYEMWTSYGEKIGIVGNLIKVGSIKINYFETDYDKGFQGNLKSIGDLKFSYFNETYNNKKANIVGKFKEQTGQDPRIIIYPFTPY